MAEYSRSVSLEDISKWKIADLRRELKAKGLSTVGKKNELFERFQLAYEDVGQGSPGSPLDNEELLDDDDVLAEDESLEEDLADGDLKPEIVLKRTLPSLKRKAVTAPEVAVVPMKKVILNRTMIANSGKENLDTAEDGEKLETTDSSKRDVIKISSIPTSAKERLEMRASKFGVTLTADAKKEVRAARFGTSVSAASSTTAPASLDALKKRAERFGASVSSTLTKVELDEKLKKRQERFGVVEPAAANEKSKPSKSKASSTATLEKTSLEKTASTSSSVKVPITFAGSAAVPNIPADDMKKKRAERFKATL